MTPHPLTHPPLPGASVLLVPVEHSTMGKPCPYAPGDVLTRIVEPGVCCRCGKRTNAPVHTCNRSRPNAWSVKCRPRCVRVAEWPMQACIEAAFRLGSGYIDRDNYKGPAAQFRDWWTATYPGHPFVTAWAWLVEIERTDG